MFLAPSPVALAPGSAPRGGAGRAAFPVKSLGAASLRILRIGYRNQRWPGPFENNFFFLLLLKGAAEG